MATIRTTCKVGACEPYCGIAVDVEDGRMVSVRPDKEHPVSKGYLCVKGHHLLEYQNDPDRLLAPERRTPGGWEPTDWPTATADIGRDLRRIVDQHGPDSIATYWGNAADSSAIILALTTAGAFGSRNAFNVLSLEFTDRGAVAGRMYGDEGVMLQPDVDRTHHALLLGTNPAVTQGMALLQRRPRVAGDLRAIRGRGGTVTVVDPRVTETTRLADTHLQIRPGTDLWLLIAMIGHILRHDLHDTSFCAAHTDDLDLWREAAGALPIERAAEICGLEPGLLVAEAERLATAPSAFVTTRVGVQTGPNTTITEWAAATLNAITGNVDRPGGMFFHGGATQPAKYLLAGLLRNNFSPSRLGAYPHIFGGLPATVLADDILSDEPGRVRALLVFAGNPLISFPDTAKTKAALERLELLVTFDIYRSDTGAYAHWNLPAATQYEKSSMHFMVDKYDPNPRLEWRPKVVEPTGHARPEWDVMQEICAAAHAPFLNNPDIHAEVLECLSAGRNYPDRIMYETVLPDGITLDDVIDTPGGIDLPSPEPGTFFERHVATPDHRIQLAPHDLVAELANVLAAKATHHDGFPLLLVSGYRRLHSFNSWTHNMPSLSKRLDEPAAHIHPATASRFGVDDGATAQVTTAAGSIRIVAQHDENLRPDVIAIPQFWGHDHDSGQTLARRRPGVNVNGLHTTSDRDTFTGMPVFNGRPCRIAPVGVAPTDYYIT